MRYEPLNLTVTSLTGIVVDPILSTTTLARCSHILGRELLLSASTLTSPSFVQQALVLEKPYLCQDGHSGIKSFVVQYYLGPYMPDDRFSILRKFSFRISFSVYFLNPPQGITNSFNYSPLYTRRSCGPNILLPRRYYHQC